MKIIIKNGIVVSENVEQKADVLVEDGVIKMIGDLEKVDVIETIEMVDASKKYILPGIVDPHVHFDAIVSGFESSDDFETGSRAALAGGVTTVIDLAMPIKDFSLKESLSARKEGIEGRSYVDYSFHSVLGKWDASYENEIEHLIQSKGIPSFKMYFNGSFNHPITDEEDLYFALNTIKKNGIIILYAESKKMINCLNKNFDTKTHLKPKDSQAAYPSWIEAKSITNAAFIANNTNSNLYISNVGSWDAIKKLNYFKIPSSKIFVETVLPYLILTEEKLNAENGYLYIKKPPLRSKEDKNLLWKAIENGHVDVIASDHASFSKEIKERGKEDFRNSIAGLPSIEWVLPLLYTEGVEKKKITMSKLVSLLCTNPSKIFGLYPKKGTFQIGSDADIIIFNPNKPRKLTNEYLFTNCNFNPYAGLLVNGEIESVYIRGKEMFKDGRILGSPQDGIFCKRHISAK